ncbi:MAG: enoyl-CoA hydratase/carnithine racemase [Caulobacter sp.]|nr:enoyl-CoA hydratase/carnithine racemase [Caulobacter sp.]
MDFQTIRYEQRGKVALITYDRQERRNAWNVPMYREIVAAIGAANAEDSVGAIVITNDGPVFCSGVDFKAPPEEKDRVTGLRPNVATLSMAPDDSWIHLIQQSKPVICAINGAAIGAGITQILAADIRVGSKSSTYAFPFTSLGLMPEIGATALLPQLIGLGRAMDLCLTAGKVDADEALRIGLITRVFDDATLVDDAVALAEKLAGFPAFTLKKTKELIYANVVEGEANAYLARETEAFVELYRVNKAARAAMADKV